MATGVFFSAMPQEMQNKSQLYGVELDILTGSMAKNLFPNADIQIKGFEGADFQDNFFDVVVGNVPFGEYRLSDDRHKALIHDFFFLRAMDKVKAGGIVALITSTGTLDKQNPSVRKKLAAQADLIGAIRLPDNAFQQTANTKITTDIIFLQKRSQLRTSEPNWVYTGLYNSEQCSNAIINQYFIENPDNMLGTLQMENSRFGKPTPVLKNQNVDKLEGLLSDVLSSIKAIEQLPEAGENEAKAEYLSADESVKNYTYTIVDGNIYYRENSVLIPYTSSAINKERVEMLCYIRNDVRAVISSQTADVFSQPPSENGIVEENSFLSKEEYLCGNVREKLEQAKVLAKKNSAFNKHIVALKAVQPERLSASDINVRLSSHWVDEKFIGIAVTKLFGTTRISAFHLIELTLNQKIVTIKDAVADTEGKVRYVYNHEETISAKQKQSLIDDKFKEWIFKEPKRRTELVEKYNKLFNSTVQRSYDGGYIKLENANPSIALLPHQLNAVSRIRQGENTLLAHVVGAGKNEAGQYFTETAKGLTTGIVLLVSQYGEEGQRHIISVFKLIIELNGLAEGSTQEKQTSKLANLLQHIDNDRIINYVGPVMSADVRQSMNVFSSTLGKLVAFIDAEMEQMICSHSKELNDIDFIEKPTAIFLICPDENPTRNFFASLFIRYLMNDLIEQARLTENVLKRQVFCLWDEFGNMPAIKGIDVLISAARSRGIRFLLALQSMSQMKKNYSENMSDIVFDSTQLLIFTRMSPTAFKTAKTLSDMLGTQTITSGSVSRGNGKSTTLQMISRPLLFPSEIITEIIQGEYIIAKSGQHPVKTNLPHYSTYFKEKIEPFKITTVNEVVAIDYLTIKALNKMTDKPKEFIKGMFD